MAIQQAQRQTGTGVPMLTHIAQTPYHIVKSLRKNLKKDSRCIVLAQWFICLDLSGKRNCRFGN